MSASHSSLPLDRRLLSFVPAVTRAFGAVRYRCPETGSFVLLTDSDALARLESEPVRCACCGRLHRLRRDDEDDAVVIGSAA